MNEMGKLLVIFGGMLILFGLVLNLLPKIPFLGKLPGDILIKRDNFTFYSPITTSIIISIVLTILVNLFIRFKK